jgi:hypothetical protein
MRDFGLRMGRHPPTDRDSLENDPPTNISTEKSAFLKHARTIKHSFTSRLRKTPQIQFKTIQDCLEKKPVHLRGKENSTLSLDAMLVADRKIYPEKE